jgi:Cu/Ag efflux protein CusF
MTVRSVRFVLLLLFPLAITACGVPGHTAAATVPLGIDLGASGPVVAPAQALPPPAASRAPAAPPQHGMQMAHDGQNDVHATGTVNSVDPAGHKVNLSHQPIPDIGWPAMTMDFSVAPTVDLRAIKPGARVNFTMIKGAGGMYEIQAITPAAGGR